MSPNSGLSPSALTGPTRPEDAATIGVDLWDVQAHLEASGYSDGAARSAGHASAAAWARELVSARTATGVAEAPGNPGEARHLSQALQRALIMLAGVVICASTMPDTSRETVVFAVAAAGWITGQMVSAAIWHGLGRGSRSDAVRFAGVTAALMLVIGIAAAVVLAEATVLIWVGWACAAPLLMTLRPGPVLVAGVLIGGVACGLTWRYGSHSAVVALASVATVALVTWAAMAARATVKHHPARRPKGAVPAVTVSLVQTVAQLAFLMAVFVRIGPGAFAAVAIAGLAAGVLSDPLFALTRLWGGWISHRMTSWRPGRWVTAAAGPLVVGALCVVAVLVTRWVLQDPYRVFLDEDVAVLAAIVAASTTAAINALLRTGAAVGAMACALVISVAGILALGYRLGFEDAWQSTPFLLVTIAAVGLAGLVTSHRLSLPSAW